MIAKTQICFKLELFIPVLSKASPTIAKCKKFPIESGLEYIPPINTVFAIQFIIANPMYMPPII